MVRPPYWRLSAFYLFYFASLGALIPYWGIYLTSIDFTPRQVGELMALIMFTKVIAPNLWGWIADRSGRPMAIVRLASLLSVVTFAGVFFGHGYWWLALVMGVFSFFWNASLPQFEAATMNFLGENEHRYSLVRLWGSVGFIITVAGIGPLLDRYGAGLLLPVLMVLFSAIWVSALTVAEPPPHRVAEVSAPFPRLIKQRGTVVVLLAAFLMQMSHSPYYVFYSIYLQENGYTHSTIGALWALGVGAEVIVFLVMGRLLMRYGARRLWLVSMGLAVVRWLIIALFVYNPVLLALAQVFHAATFGVFHAVAIHLIHGMFTGSHQGRGQALYSSLSFGAGGGIGSLAAGWLWAGAGGTGTYLIAAGIAGLAFLVVWRGGL